MAFLSDETVLAVKRAVEIHDVVSGYFPLKKAGSNYKACCPFHEEKTPSFNVHPEKQIFKCFGCGVAGDAIKFVMLYEKAEFIDAIKILAEKFGVPITYQETGGTRGPSKEDLVRVNEWAAGIFRAHLATSMDGAVARDFLKRRGVTDETSEKWRLGYSLPSWDALITRAKKAGYDEALLMQAGLAKPREGGRGAYDTFRNRVMFPIFDVRGKVIAFGARTLGDDQPKFLNSPETAAFSKGKTLFGLDRAKDEIEEARTLFIVEGYLDVIIPHQASVAGFVATLGTALTREHLKVIRRYADRVVLVYDADAAGQKASERGLDLLLAEDMDLFVAKLPAGQDPDDVVVKQGADALRAMVSKPQEMFDFLVASLCEKIDVTTTNGKTKVVEELVDRIAQIPSDVKREVLLQQVAVKFHVPDHALRSRMTKPAAGTPARQAAVAAAVAPATGVLEKLGRELVALLLHRPTQAELMGKLPAERFPTDATRRIASKAYEHLAAGRELQPSELVSLMQDGMLMQVAAESAEIEIDPAKAVARLAECLDYLAGRDYAEKAQAVQQGLRSAQSDDEKNRWLQELMQARKDRPNDQRLMPRG